MKNYFFLTHVGLMIVLLSGCQDTDEKVIGRAHSAYEIMRVRYQDFSGTMTESAILSCARELSSTRTVGVWGLLMRPSLVQYGGAVPLNRAVYIMESDLGELHGHMARLESRGFAAMPLYTQIASLRVVVADALRVVRASKEYSEELRYINEQHLKERQLAESSKQTYLLQEIADRPCVVEERVIITQPVCPVKKTIETVHVLSSPCAPKKHKKIVITDVCKEKESCPTRHVII